MTPTPTVCGMVIEHSRVVIGTSDTGTLQALIAAGAVFTALFTIHMAFSTRRYANIATRTYKALHRPFILAMGIELLEDAEPHILHIAFAAHNGGGAAAKGCQVRVSRADFSGALPVELERPLDTPTTTPLPIVVDRAMGMSTRISLTKRHPDGRHEPVAGIRGMILDGSVELTLTLQTSYEGMDGQSYEHESKHRYEKPIGRFIDLCWVDKTPPRSEDGEIRKAAKRVYEFMERLGLV